MSTQLMLALTYPIANSLRLNVWRMFGMFEARMECMDLGNYWLLNRFENKARKFSPTWVWKWEKQ